MQIRKIRALFLGILIFLAGCTPLWQQIKEEYSWKTRNFQAPLPPGWMKFNWGTYELFLTKDGETLDAISIFKFVPELDRERKAKMKPKELKERIDQMLPQELAEVVVDYLSLNKGMLNMNILGNVPASVDGNPGFKVEYSYNTADNLKLRSIIYGIVIKKEIYLIQYLAAEQCYFAKELPVFERLIPEIKVLNR